MPAPAFIYPLFRTLSFLFNLLPLTFLFAFFSLSVRAIYTGSFCFLLVCRFSFYFSCLCKVPRRSISGI